MGGFGKLSSVVFATVCLASVFCGAAASSPPSNEKASTKFLGEKEADNLPMLRILAVFAVCLATFLVWDFGVTPNDVIWGIPFHKNLTSVRWPDDMTVANTKTVAVSFKNLQGRQFSRPMSRADFTVEVVVDHRRIENVSVVESGNELHIIFGAQASGMYGIMLWANLHCVRGFPVARPIRPGNVDPERTLFYRLQSRTLVLTSGIPEDIRLDARDKFGNAVDDDNMAALPKRIGVKVWKTGAKTSADVGSSASSNFVAYRTTKSDCVCISVAFTSGEEGWYKAQVQLDGVPVSSSPDLSLIVLSRNESSRVDAFMRARKNKGLANRDGDECFEASLVALRGQPVVGKAKKVFVYLTDKQVIVREYFLRIFAKRAFTFRVVPATRMSLVRYQAGRPVVRIEDSYQKPGPEFCLADGNVMAACFLKMLLYKVGGSESFLDKQAFFNAKLLDYHDRKGHRHTQINFAVKRGEDLLASSMKALRSFSDADWAKLFVVRFDGEPGVDEGGVRREWFELVSKSIFDPGSGSGLFVPVEEDSPAVMPNPAMTRLAAFEFAGRIVGKCLLEGAHGPAYRQLLPVRLAKSFLAQLVGLRVTCEHFSDDAPDFFASKVRRIECSDLDDPDSGMDDLTFSEEVHGFPLSAEARVVDLRPNGRHERVTNANKAVYLDLLAQHRLLVRTQDKAAAFLRGLHAFVPDSLLCLFDESQFELMVCGLRSYSVADLRSNHLVVSAGLSSKTLGFFWTSLAHMTTEQLAKLVQFTTGSSQLPLGGFGQLRPPFQICSGHTLNALPTAHTCFNMICLSEHGKFADFEKALLTAINEGSEGFELA